MNIPGANLTFDGGSFSISIIPNKVGSPLTPPSAGVSALTKAVDKFASWLGFNEMIGVESVSFGFNVERSAYKGAGRFQKGMTPGFLYYGKGKLTLWQADLLHWIDVCGGVQSFAIYNDFDVLIEYKGSIADEGVVALVGEKYKIELKNCRPSSVSTTHNTSSPDVLTSDLEFDVGYVQVNGNKGLEALSKIIGVASTAGNLF